MSEKTANIKAGRRNKSRAVANLSVAKGSPIIPSSTLMYILRMPSYTGDITVMNIHQVNLSSSLNPSCLTLMLYNANLKQISRIFKHRQNHSTPHNQK